MNFVTTIGNRVFRSPVWTKFEIIPFSDVQPEAEKGERKIEGDINQTMRRYMYLISFLILGLVIGEVVVSAVTLEVPEDYPTIQAAVDAATLGDVIEVTAGTYSEGKIGVNHSLSFVGENKTDTILDVGGNSSGFYSSTDAINISGFKVMDFTSHGVNFQDGSNSSIVNNVFDPGGPAISAVQAFSNVSGVEVSNNEMYGVGIAAYMGSCDSWTISHNSIDIENNPRMGVVGGGSNYVIEYNDIINSGSPSDEGNHQAIDTYQFGDTSDWTIRYNNIYGNEDGIQIEGPGHEVHYNSIYDNAFIGLTCDSQIDATLNWWGSSDGPWYDEDRDGVSEYDGGGDKIYGSTYFSPWLGINPDDDPNKVGVQLKSPMKFIVAKAGPEPPDGYLNTAISASNDQINFPGSDTIQVKKGTYNPSQSITDSTKLMSESGPVSDFILNGNLSVESPGVIIGGPDQGFTVNGNIIVVPGVSGSSVALHYNFISGLLTHNGSGTVDASVNYWGANGPEDNLAGDKSSIIYSPWLGTLPGGSPTVYLVDDVGAEPEGSLQRAISYANTAPDRDMIMVNDGDYTVSADKPVTQSTEIVSTTGCPANACINGELTIEAEKVLLGKREELTNTNKGFTIDGDVTVASGVDAFTIRINWNNIYGTVTNNGEGTLDAEYNWWGNSEGPTADDAEGSVEGDVDYEPYLPADVCSVLEYMDENNITNPEDAVAGMTAEDLSSSEEVIAQLTTMGFNPDEAEELLNEFGLGRVFSAMDGARDSQEFIELLGGYSLPAGAAGGLTNNIVAGGAGSVGGKTVGAVFEICEPVRVSFPLADFQGNPATDLHPTVSLIELNKQGEKQGLQKISTANYSEDEKAYMATFDTCDLKPSYYEVQIDLPVLTSLSQVVKLEEKGS